MNNEKWTTIEAVSINGSTLQSENCRISEKNSVLDKFNSKWANHKKVIVQERKEPNSIIKNMVLEGFFG